MPKESGNAPNEGSLFHWMRNQRSLGRENLRDDQVALLEGDHGPFYEWRWPVPRKDSWYTTHTDLVNFAKENGAMPKRSRNNSARENALRSLSRSS